MPDHVRPPGAPADLASAEAAMDVGLERNADAGNYLDWLADLCAPYLGDDVLELGSGLGDLTERFARTARSVHASDISDHHVAVLTERFAGRDEVRVSRIDIADFEPDHPYDTIVMMNVLEHIEDDGAALDALHDALRPGGHLVLYVPAFMALYSRFDREIGHYRRYRRDPLRALVQRHGFRVEDARYVNSVGALGWFAWCRLLGQKSSDQITVSTCDRVVVPVVRRVEQRYAPPFGLSVFLAARKPG